MNEQQRAVLQANFEWRWIHESWVDVVWQALTGRWLLHFLTDTDTNEWVYFDRQNFDSDGMLIVIECCCWSGESNECGWLVIYFNGRTLTDTDGKQWCLLLHWWNTTHDGRSGCSLTLSRFGLLNLWMGVHVFRQKLVWCYSLGWGIWFGNKDNEEIWSF